MIFDFHAHLTFRPFNSITIYSENQDPPDIQLWKERFRPKDRISKIKNLLEKEINTTSQLHLDSVAKSGIRCICNSLYPLERTFTRHKGVAFVIRELTKYADFTKTLFGPTFLKLLATLTGYEVEPTLRQLDDGDFNYYTHLQGEYDFMVENQHNAGGMLQYEIASDYNAVKRISAAGKLAVIHTIEGTTAFLERSGDFKRLLNDERQGNVIEIIATLTRNIRQFKDLPFPPFIITLAHHQYNFICGHSESFTGVVRTILKQNGRSTNENSETKISFYDIGIRSWGYGIIDLLLSREEGNCGRILIDTKHMSVWARQDYHRYLTKVKKNDHIPIVQTHTCVNGRSWNEDKKHWQKGDLDLKKRFRDRIPFNTSAINAFDEEIIDIIDSDGLIGIMLDEKRLVGAILPPDTNKLILDLDLPYNQRVDTTANDGGAKELATNKLPKSRFHYNKDRFKTAMLNYIRAKENLEKALLDSHSTPSDKENLRKKVEQQKDRVDKIRGILLPIEMSLLMNQFLHILQITKKSKAKAWYHICIGSDYEGVINPLDIFYYAGDLSDLKSSMVNFWHFAIEKAAFDEEFKKYKDSIDELTPEFIVNRILWDNSQDFMRKYFNDKYRRQGIVPENI